MGNNKLDESFLMEESERETMAGFKDQFQDSRKKRIIENIAEAQYRGTLSKAKLEKTLEYNMGSPLKNQNFQSMLNETTNKQMKKTEKTA